VDIVFNLNDVNIIRHGQDFCTGHGEEELLLIVLLLFSKCCTEVVFLFFTCPNNGATAEF